MMCRIKYSKRVGIVKFQARASPLLIGRRWKNSAQYVT